jgi:Fic family protein
MSSIAELRLREKDLKDNYPDVFSKMESIARIQSIKGSNEIEGIVTSEQRINEIIHQNSRPLNHDEEEIAGYRDALSRVHNEYMILDIHEQDVLRLHEILLSHTASRGGHYKTSDNIIMERDMHGNRVIRFTPVSAAEVNHYMEQLTLAYLEARSNYNINQLLLIPCYILDFLCIHPFQDGNGRISRLLSLLLLYKNGFDSGRYISFEQQINQTKMKYYQALKDSSDRWHEGSNSYFPFMIHFVMTLLYCYKELDKRFAVVSTKKVSKQKRVEATVLNSLLPISKSEICYILPDISPHTVELVLNRMVKEGIVSKVGEGKNTKYIRKK